MIFEVKNGCFGYGKNTNILNQINFTVKDGEVLSILGPNGVGKTTLLRCMMGMISWKKGETCLEGINICQIPKKELWQKIAYVPQAKGFAFGFTLEEMVMFGRSAHIGMIGKPQKADVEICYERMNQMGIWHLRDRYCNQVSGGELQMALIARALCAEPFLLILDEPESNLDFKNQLIILDTIGDLAKSQNLSCIFNTHYPVHALRISSDSMILARDGSCIYGKTKEVITNETMKKVFQVNVHINHVNTKEYDYHTVTALSISQ